MTTRLEPYRVALYGVGSESPGQHHQRDMYLPALRALDVEVTGLVGFGARGADFARSSMLAEIGIDDLASADLIIACPDPQDDDGVRDMLEQTAGAGVPVLLDKPTLFPASLLRQWADRYPHVVAAHHIRFHPAAAAVTGRIRASELGLVHAIHGELLVANSDRPHPLGEMRNLVVYGLDLVQSLIGDLHGRGTAFVQPPKDGAGEAITIGIRLDPDVVLTLLVGRGAGATSGSVHRYRILGSHGQALVDLAGPSFELADGRRVPFGPNSLERMIGAVLAGARAPGLAVAAELAAVIDALARSAESGRTVEF